jgi:hemoglobin
MKLIKTIICVGLLMAIPFMGAAVAVHAEDKGKSLYERLGGYDAISAVVSEFANSLFSDQKLGSFFGGWNADKQARFKQLNTLLVCNATGGPCLYLGRTMADTHQGMRINDAQFDQVAGHLSATLDKFKVPQAREG